MAEAFFPDGSTVLVSQAGGTVNQKALTNYCTNFSQSGGTRETESIAVFGGANITKQNPRDQIEISFDVIVNPANAMIFDEMLFSSTLTGTSTPINSDTEGQSLRLVVTWTDNTNTYTRQYDNCYLTSWDPTMGADGQLEGSITFKMAPTTSAGVANLTITHASP